MALISIAVFADVRLLRKWSPALAGTDLGGCDVCMARWLALVYVAAGAALEATGAIPILGLPAGLCALIWFALWAPCAGGALLLLEWAGTLAPAVVELPEA